MARTARKYQTRKTQARDEYRPTGMLDTPEPPDGWEFRWIRHEMLGQDDSRNVYEAQRDGWIPVQVEEIDEEWMPTALEKPGVRYTGAVRINDVILCKKPIKDVDKRTDFYDSRADILQAAVDEQLKQHDSDLMPISVDRKSRVSRGIPFQEED